MSLVEPLGVGNLFVIPENPCFLTTQPTEYGHADVAIHKVDSHVDRLFAGLGETMHGELPTSQYEVPKSSTDSNSKQPT